MKFRLQTLDDIVIFTIHLSEGNLEIEIKDELENVELREILSELTNYISDELDEDASADISEIIESKLLDLTDEFDLKLEDIS